MTPMAGGTKPRSNLQLRIISGVILAAAVLVLTWWGGFPFRLFAAAMAAAMFHEWMTIRGENHKVHLAISRFALAAALALMLVGFAPAFVFAGLFVAAAVAAISGLATGRGLWAGWGVLYAGLPAATLIFLRGNAPEGLWTIVFLFAVVWGTDTIAYFTGRALGGPKLAPSISPGKTWSGAIGGAIGGVIASLIVAYFAWDSVNLLMVAIVAILLSIASQAGDLFESAVKRRHGVKDSGNLIPGHGGVMDRVDGLVAASVLLFVLWIPFLAGME